MRANLSAEIVFTCAIFLTVLALIVYGLIIKRLQALIKVRGMWVLPVLGSAFLIGCAVLHIYRMLIYFPLLGTAGPSDLFDLIIGSLHLSRFESLLLLAAGICSCIGGLLYYRVSTR